MFINPYTKGALMSTYYIPADAHSNSTELAIEKRGKIMARYSVPTSKPSAQSTTS